MNIELCIKGHDFDYELECVLRLFFPSAKISLTDTRPDCGIFISVTEDKELVLYVSISLFGKAMESEKRIQRARGANGSSVMLVAVMMFWQLVEITGIRPPWGVLTGVRPVRFCRSLMERGMDSADVLDTLVSDYLVEEKKACLALKINDKERDILSKNIDNSYSLYISIPFCPSRCLYCSFVSSETGASMKLIPDYIRLLREELLHIAGIARENNLNLQTVYIGGGTPASLSADEIASVMGAVSEYFDLSGLLEYTVEAGRPDVITPEKLKIIKQYGASRISVNPQTMSNTVLKNIGRNHTAEQFVESFNMARELGFDCVNTDIIAGLPGDTTAGFMDTVERLIALSPENITVHTLTVKRSSALRESDGAYNEPDMDIAAALDMAGEKLAEAGYIPYYMYRQKGTHGNHENTGYSKPGAEGIYNVYIMEEEHTILAAGAGAVSKICLSGDINRIYNYKYPREYIDGFGEMLRRKDEAGRIIAGG